MAGVHNTFFPKPSSRLKYKKGKRSRFDQAALIMVRVCHIISGDLWAGAEVMTRSLLKNLRKHKELKLSAILFNKGRLAEEIRKLDIRVDVLDENKIDFAKMLFQMKNILNRSLPDIIHSHRPKENISSFLASRSGVRPKLIATQHGLPEFYGTNKNVKYVFMWKLNLLLLKRCFHSVVSVSCDVQETLVKLYGLSKDSVAVIYNGIKIPKYFQTKDKKEHIVVGSSGRLCSVKDYPLMVEIAREVLETKNNIRFELAGDGPEGTKIQALIRKYGLDNVFLLRGFVKDMPPFYQGLDLYLNTSLHEGIPMSVLEAMAHGLPVIAPKVGGLREIVDDGVEGYLVEGRDPRAFAEKCLLLYENNALRQQMSEAAREKVVREFSMEHMAEEYYKLYVGLARNG